jgi:predicted MFS family arabinose efflux permease
MWQSQTIKGLLLLLAVSGFLSRPYIVLMPVFARDVLQADARGYGLLMSAIGVGSVCGALVAASLKQGYHGRWLVGASLAFPVFLILFAFSRWMLLSIGLLLLASTNQLTQQVVASSSLQLATTDEFHGRVASFLVLLNNGLTRLGGIQAGAVTQYWSAPVSVSGGAILSLVCMLIVIWRIPAVRQLQ